MREPSLVEDEIGARGLADGAAALVDRRLTDARPDHERPDHEDHPAANRQAAVTGAPATHSGRQVAGWTEHCFRHGNHLGLVSLRHAWQRPTEVASGI